MSSETEAPDPLPPAIRDSDLILIGSSNSWAINSAADAAGMTVDNINFWNWNDNPRTPDTFDLVPKVKDRIRGARVFSTIGGAVPTKFALIRHPRPFGFVPPNTSSSAPPSDLEMIPYGAVCDAIDVMAEEDLVAMRYTHAAIGGPFYQIQSPPPLEQHEIIHLYVDKQLDISCAVLRLDVWKIYSDVMRKTVEAFGGIYIPCPAAAVDRRGYLRPEFHKDAVHGNDEYGALVLDQIRGHLPA